MDSLDIVFGSESWNYNDNELYKKSEKLAKQYKIESSDKIKKFISDYIVNQNKFFEYIKSNIKSIENIDEYFIVSYEDRKKEELEDEIETSIKYSFRDYFENDKKDKMIHIEMHPLAYVFIELKSDSDAKKPIVKEVMKTFYKMCKAAKSKLNVTSSDITYSINTDSGESKGRFEAFCFYKSVLNVSYTAK